MKSLLLSVGYAWLTHKVASLIIKFMIRTWKIASNKVKEIRFKDESSLDAITCLLPNGYYSTFRTYDSCTRVIGLSAHLRRLPELDASSLRRHLIQLLEQFRPPFACTCGTGTGGPRARRGETADEARVRVMMTFSGQVYVSIEPLKRLPRKVYEKGVSVVTVSVRRENPRMKLMAFIGQRDDERKQISKKGIFEALMVKNGRVLEGMTSNFFYVHNGILHTAQRDVLLGVTRRTVIRVARGEGLGVRYKSLKLDQLSAVSEAFITSSSRGVVPVVQIDNVQVGQGSVGKITKKLTSAYDTYVMNRAERIAQKRK